MTQEELARAAGASQSSIAAYETGSKSTTWNTIERIAAFVGLEIFLRLNPPPDPRGLAQSLLPSSGCRQDSYGCGG